MLPISKCLLNPHAKSPSSTIRVFSLITAYTGVDYHINLRCGHRRWMHRRTSQESIRFKSLSRRDPDDRLLSQISNVWVSQRDGPSHKLLLSPHTQASRRNCCRGCFGDHGCNTCDSQSGIEKLILALACVVFSHRICSPLHGHGRPNELHQVRVLVVPQHPELTEKIRLLFLQTRYRNVVASTSREKQKIQKKSEDSSRHVLHTSRLRRTPLQA